MKNKDIDTENLTKYEENAIIKYEKGAKPYRPKRYKRMGTFVVCQKCGSPYNLTKTTVNGVDYWFCKSCIMQRAKQIQKDRSKVIPEREQ